MSRTLLQVITKVAQIIDPKHYMTGTTSSSGNAVGSIVDITANGLQRFNNDAIVGKHFYWSGGTPSPNTTTVTNFTQSTGKALIRPDLAAAPNSEVYYLLPYRKQLIEDAVANAIWTLHDTGDLVREILMYGYVAGSPIYNAGFDYWTSATTPDGWSRNGSATLAKEPAGANTFMSRQSLKVSGAADYVKLDEPWKSWLEDFKISGSNVRFYCPVLANNASHARIAVYDGSTIHYSPYHSGGGSREILDTGDINISSTATDLEIRLYNDDTNAVYFGDSWIEGGGVSVRELPIALDYASDIAIVEGLESGRPTDTTVGKYHHAGRGQTIYDYALAFHTDHETTTRYGLMQFTGRNKPSDGRRLRITASGQLSVPATDTGVIEVSRTEELMVAYLAAALLLEGDATTRSESVSTDLRTSAGELRAKVGELAGGIGQNRQQATLPRSM
jgi:hypothetical protein